MVSLSATVFSDADAALLFGVAELFPDPDELLHDNVISHGRIKISFFIFTILLFNWLANYFE